MTKKVIDDSNLGHLVSKAKAAFGPKEDVINVNLADVATSGDYNDLSNKPTIPDVSNFITKSVNDLTNYYLKSETYTKEEVAALIGAIQQFHYEIAASTSAVTSPANNVLYLIGPTGSGSDKYEEYVYDETKPVAERGIKIGDTSIDLSGYVTTTFLSTELAKYATIASLAAVATSGSYNDLSNKPTIPTDVVKYTSQSLTDAQKEQARTNIGATDKEVFWAEYGVTTFDDIKAASDAGKVVMVKYADQTAQVPYNIPLATVGENDGFGVAGFCISLDKYSLVISVMKYGGQSVWVEPRTIEYQENKLVSSGQSTPDNDHYPSEKLVKDSLDAKQPTIDANHKLDYSLLSNTPTIPAAPVNADWNATSGLAEILNKPTVPTTYAGSPTAGGFANKAVAIPFGQVDAGSTATEITATVDNFPETLTDGVCAYIRNNVIASASGGTLNVNGTGEKPVYNTIADATRVSSVFNANSTYLFVYNSSRVEGGCWDIYYGYNANDNTVGYMLRTNGASAPPAAQKYYRYRLLFTSANRQNLVPANTSSSTSATTAKTVNQTKIDPFGVIFYYSYSSTVNASASPNAAYLGMQYNGIHLGYSFNRTGEALEMTARDPVYLKCAPQSDGSAIIDADNPIVQALPTTADGKIYIFLGFAENATDITLYYWHPVYYHDGTRIVIGSGKQDTLTFDTTPTENSTNPVTSGGIYNAITENEQVVAAALNDLNDRLNNVDVEEMTSVTGAELVNLRDNSQLKPGHQYRITDYVTRVMSERCRSMEHPFDIIVMANSTSSLNEDAKAILHEGNSYFNESQNTDSGTELNFRGSNIEGGELKYCLDNDRDRFSGACNSEYIESYVEQNYSSHIFGRDSSNDIDSLYCGGIYSDEPGISIGSVYTKVEHPSVGTTVYDSDGETELGEIYNYCSGPGKGVIYHMKDDQDNVAEYDFKNVQFLKRFNGFDEYNYHNFNNEGSDQEGFYPLTFHLIDDNYDPVHHCLADASMVSTIYNDNISYDYNSPGNDCRNNYLGYIEGYTCIVATETISSYYPAYLPQDGFIDTMLSAYVLKEDGTNKKVQSERFMPRYNINESDDNGSNYDEYLATSKAIDNRITDRTQYTVQYGPTRYTSYMSSGDIMVFEGIPEFGTSADIYLKTTDSNYAGTVSVSYDYLSVSYYPLANGYSYTPTTLGSDGMYYVKLGTVSSTHRYLCVKGASTNVGSGNANIYCKFHITAPCYVGGNMMSLIGKTSQNDISDDTFNVSYLFNNFFKDEINLFSHPSYRLFITSVRIPPYSYQHMFDGCKNMTISPYVSFTDAGNSYCCTDMFSNTDNLKCLITGDTNSTYVNRYIPDKKFNELYYIAGKNASNNEKALYTSSDIRYPLISIIAYLSNNSLFEKIKLQQLHTSSDYSVDPNKLFGFGTITGSITFTLSSKEDSIMSNHYFGMFDTGATAPTITGPSGLTGVGGSAPTILPNKHYEISVLNNIAVGMEV